MVIGTEDSPARLGRYDVRGKIGEGGMAVVYLGRTRGESDPDRRLVALKVIKSVYSMNTEFLTMFADEAKIVERLHHPAIVRVWELGAEGSRLFMAMEFLNGQSLWQLWSACRDRAIRLRYDVLAYIGARVAEGLHHAHELREERGSESLNLVHRDVNPQNIFLTYDGQVKIIDFGLAWANNKSFKTRVGVVKGKLAYLSPEQALGKEVDRRTDVFALAVTLWELSTDRRLFRVEDDAETVERVVAGVIPNPVDLVEGYPAGLWEVLKRGLARNPSDRYATAAEFSLALDAFVRTQGDPVTPATVEDILDALFPDEKAENAQWLATAEAGAPQRTTMRPASSRPADMPEMPGPPSVPFNLLPLGDFAPPSLPILPGTDHLPISSSRARLEAVVSSGVPSVPFEYIKPIEIDDAPRSIQLGVAELAASKEAALYAEARASELPAPLAPSTAPADAELGPAGGSRRLLLVALAVVIALVLIVLKFAL